MKRALFAGVLVLLLAAHFVYWYLPRERAVTPDLPAAAVAGGGAAAGGARGVGGAGDAGGGSGEGAAPLAVLASGAYDACLWVPYPHQNLGALSSSVADLPAVIAAAVRLSRGARSAAAAAASSSGEPEELPGFGPFEVPPADEIVACTDLAGGRFRVVARIYPTVAVVAKLAGHLAGNPWLAGGEAGRLHVAWSGRLWSVTAGSAAPAAATAPVATRPPALPESLAVVRWNGARPEIPAGYYALTRAGSDLALSLTGAAAPAGGAMNGWAGSAAGPPPVLVAAVGAGWSRETPAASAAIPAGPAPPAMPAALALFESGSSRLSSLGDLPGLAVFNVPAAPTGAGGVARERWGLPAGGVFHLLTGRLPSAQQDGWHITALDTGSLRQAEALAPRLSALLAPAAPSGGPAGGSLSLGLWLEPRATVRVVSRIRRFVEDFPLASRSEIELWRDWETVLDPLARCRHATLTAASAPPSLRLVLAGCTAEVPQPEAR